MSKDRLRGIRIFDISDIAHPKNVGNVQTCRGSHTHTVLVDPKDTDNVYVYISGSAPVRSSERAAGLRRRAMPDEDPNSALFRIEVIKVPLAHPGAGGDRQLAADLRRPGRRRRRHGEAPEDSSPRPRRSPRRKAQRRVHRR